MRCRDHIALTLPPFLLRLALAITFLWAGTAKIVGTTTVQGDNAARLANLGVTFIADTPAPEPESETPNEPASPLPGTNVTPDDDSTPTIDDAIDQVIDEAEELLTNPESETKTETESESSENPVVRSVDFAPYSIRRVVQSVAPAVGSDYPDPVKIKRVYGIALLVDHAANPALTEDSQPVSPLLPKWMGKGKMPVISAWATAITELAAGVFLLIGFLTRLSAFSLMTVMLVALWSTNIGPAMLHDTNAILGFIPRAADVWDPSSYNVMLWQFALIIMSLSVMLLGAGPLSIDRILFRPGRRDPYVTGGSGSNTPPAKPAKPVKHRADPEAPPQDRSAFDRTPPPRTDPTP